MSIKSLLNAEIKPAAQKLIVFASAILVYFISGYWFKAVWFYFDEPFNFIYYAYFFILTIFLLCFSTLFFLKSQRNMSTAVLSKVFNKVVIILTIPLLLVFLFGIYETICMVYESVLWFGIDTSCLDIDIFLEDVGNIIIYMPFLIIIGLFYWAIKIRDNRV